MDMQGMSKGHCHSVRDMPTCVITCRHQKMGSTDCGLGRTGCYVFSRFDDYDQSNRHLLSSFLYILDPQMGSSSCRLGG